MPALLISILFFHSIFYIKNRRLRIYSDCICKTNTCGKEIVYRLNTKQMTIKVDYNYFFVSGIKLTFLVRNNQKILTFVLLEGRDFHHKKQARRKIWAEGLKKIGCSIEDEGRYLFEHSIYRDHSDDDFYELQPKSTRKEDIEYVKRVLKRTIWAISLGLFISLISLGGTALYLYFIEYEKLVPLILSSVLAFQILVWLIFMLVYGRRLRLDDNEIMKQGFAKRILEFRKFK